jgi:hypothetical protein
VTPLAGAAAAPDLREVQRTSGPRLAEAPHAGWDPLELQAHLARLPPAQPCLSCPSHGKDGALVLLAPQLEKAARDGVDEYSAVFACPLCGAERRAAL